MNNKTAERLELETGCKSIEFNTDGLFVFFEPGRTDGIVICGIDGRAYIGKEKIIEVSRSLRYYTDLKKFKLKGKIGETILSGGHAAALADDLPGIAQIYLTEVS